MKIRIVGGRIVDPGNNRDEIADILIVDGKIVCLLYTSDAADE